MDCDECVVQHTGACHDRVVIHVVGREIRSGSCHDVEMAVEWHELETIGLAAGLDAVGVAGAEPFLETLGDLEARKAAGLHGGIQFTYRNPRRSTDPSVTMTGARSLVVGALDYTRPAPDRPSGEPVGRVASYSWEDYYAELRTALDKVAEALRGHGHRARVVADQNNLVDRAVAHRAGLGWWGKSSNILIPGVGSMVVLGAVLTDAEITGGRAEPVADRCGTCTRCIAACPTGAIVAPGVVDARRCLAWLLQLDGDFPVEFRAALGDRIYGCDDCQDACPPNQVRQRSPLRPATAEAWVPIIEMLTVDDDSLMERYGRWYIPRRDPDIIRRNALVVLANIGDRRDPATEAVLRSALVHRSEMLRSHAAWAARQLGLSHLAGSVTT